MTRANCPTTLSSSATWVFAYGSLIWHPGFEFSQRTKAHLPGWSRRFWQASTDHRGVPGAPGRVVTLVRHPDHICTGIAYRLDNEIDATLAYLDNREQGGYIRHYTALELPNHSSKSVLALIYIGDIYDYQYVGPETDDQIAETISSAVGPSGSNREYCLQLADALRRENIRDLHVESIASKIG